ncbi:MAG: hypothetical protein GY711_31095 [bacterium]|nr:hypothetical protein [bacterium]
MKQRRTKLIQPALQLRLIGAFAGLTLLALLAQFLVLGAVLGETANALPNGGTDLAGEIPTILGRALLISLGLVLPALFLIGVRATFKIAGPLYRFERHLTEVSEGQQPGPCRLREKDQLKGLCELINTALVSEYERGVAEAKGGQVETPEAESGERSEAA